MKKTTKKTAEPKVNVAIKRLNATQITRLQKQLELITQEKLLQEEKATAAERAAKAIGAGRQFVSLLEGNTGARDIFMQEIVTALGKNLTTLEISREDHFPITAKYVKGFFVKDRAAVAAVNVQAAARKEAIVARKEAILNQVYFGDTAPDVCALLAEFRQF